MSNLRKNMLALFFFGNLCLCVSLYLKEELDTNDKVLAPIVITQRPNLRFKKHNIKLGECPKDMVWYYGKCVSSKQKEDNYYDYEDTAYDDELVSTESTKHFVVDTTTSKYKLHRNSISTTENEVDAIIYDLDSKKKMDDSISGLNNENETKTVSVSNMKNETKPVEADPNFNNGTDDDLRVSVNAPGVEVSVPEYKSNSNYWTTLLYCSMLLLIVIFIICIRLCIMDQLTSYSKIQFSSGNSLI